MDKFPPVPGSVIVQNFPNDWYYSDFLPVDRNVNPVANQVPILRLLHLQLQHWNVYRVYKMFFNKLGYLLYCKIFVSDKNFNKNIMTKILTEICSVAGRDGRRRLVRPPPSRPGIHFDRFRTKSFRTKNFRTNVTGHEKKISKCIPQLWVKN
jgi:hypothetical protein